MDLPGHREPKRPRGLLRRLVPALAAACVLVIASLGVFLSNGPTNGNGDPLVDEAIRHGVGPDLLAESEILELAEDLEWVEEFQDVAKLTGNGG
jgi:hypothetical protein